MSNRIPAVASGAPVLAVLLVSGIPAPAPAAEPAPDSERIEVLQRQVSDLQVRVERLEAELREGVPVNPARKVQPVPGGWRKVANWNLLAKGLDHAEVEEILGAPQSRKTVSKFEFWGYADGKVRFYLRRLKSWEPPSAIEGQLDKRSERDGPVSPADR
jgi:hypothetical protein